MISLKCVLIYQNRGDVHSNRIGSLSVELKCAFPNVKTHHYDLLLIIHNVFSLLLLKSDPYAVTLCFNAVTRIRTGVAAATTQSTNHYTITASYQGRSSSITQCGSDCHAVYERNPVGPHLEVTNESQVSVILNNSHPQK